MVMVMVATLTRPTAPSAKKGDVVRMVQAVWRRGRREDKKMVKDERERVCVCGVEKRSGSGRAERVKSERGKEGHEREMCVRTGVHERLSCTISQRY